MTFGGAGGADSPYATGSKSADSGGLCAAGVCCVRIDVAMNWQWVHFF